MSEKKIQDEGGKRKKVVTSLTPPSHNLLYTALTALFITHHSELRQQFEIARQQALKRIDNEAASIASMTRQIEREFEYEERLEKAMARQKLINSSLELNQSDKSAQALEEVAMAWWT